MILAGCQRFAIGTIADVIASIDVALELFVKACINLCPLISVKIVLKYAYCTMSPTLIIANVLLYSVTLILNVVLLRLLGFVNLLGCLGL